MPTITKHMGLFRIANDADVDQDGGLLLGNFVFLEVDYGAGRYQIKNHLNRVDFKFGTKSITDDFNKHRKILGLMIEAVNLAEKELKQYNNNKEIKS